MQALVLATDLRGDGEDGAICVVSAGSTQRDRQKESPVSGWSAGQAEGRCGATETEERRQSRLEVRVDGAIHAAAIAAAIVGAVALLWLVNRHGATADVGAVAIYSTGLLLMLSCSCAYNVSRQARHRDWLLSLDNCAIFAMIAGTYTPFTMLHMQGKWSVALTVGIWSVAIAGMLVRLFQKRLFARISLWLYLALGWAGVVVLVPLVQALNTTTLILLMAGGVLYTVGIVFHLWEGLPFRVAIWHAFVVAAAAVHYAAVVGSIIAPGPVLVASI